MLTFTELMVKISIGTAGWDYKDWIGPFYPKNIERSLELEFLSKYFDLVEINNTFYNLPSINMVENWNKRVPQNFRFIVKVWQKISHNLNDLDIDSHIYEFFTRLSPLKNKVIGFLIQFPPWFKFSEKHLEQIISLLKEIPGENRYFIELRDNSWFKSEILAKFINKRIILVTTYKPNLEPFYLQNQIYYYIRLIGDRKLTKFNRVQREQKDSINDLNENIQKIRISPEIYEIFIIVNNHFAGYAPESVNNLKQKFGLTYRNFTNQKSLNDFLKYEKQN